MLAKLTGKNQLTLPKAILDQLPVTVYFDVETEGGRLILTPVRITRIDAVRQKLAQLGITDEDVEDAVRWARSKE